MKNKSSKSFDLLSLMLPGVGSIDSTTLTSLPRLQEPAPPRFPTFSDLVGASVSDQPAVRPETGLFEGMLNNDPLPLFQDLVDCPHKYQPGTDVLLQQIISGQKTMETLTPDERLLLDYATLEYTQPSRAPVEEPLLAAEREEDPADYLPELRDKTEDEPPDSPEMDKFWWRHQV